MNNNKLVEELREYIYCCGGEQNLPSEEGFPENVFINVDDFNNILSRYKAIEPFEKLAFRKGILYIEILPFRDGKFEIDLGDHNTILKSYVGDTYAEVEQKARAFLETLPDQNKGG